MMSKEKIIFIFLWFFLLKCCQNIFVIKTFEEEKMLIKFWYDVKHNVDIILKMMLIEV